MERKAAAEILERIPAGHIILADKGYAGQAFEQLVAGHGARLIRPDRRDEPARHGSLDPVCHNQLAGTWDRSLIASDH